MFVVIGGQIENSKHTPKLSHLLQFISHTTQSAMSFSLGLYPVGHVQLAPSLFAPIHDVQLLAEV